MYVQFQCCVWCVSDVFGMHEVREVYIMVLFLQYVCDVYCMSGVPDVCMLCATSGL